MPLLHVLHENSGGMRGGVMGTRPASWRSTGCMGRGWGPFDLHFRSVC
jgi:hypothetical protein